MDNINAVKETTLTVEKRRLVLVRPYLGSITIQTRTKLMKSSLIVANCKTEFKTKTRLGKNFDFKD